MAIQYLHGLNPTSVEQIARELCIPTVPVLFRGIIHNETTLKDLINELHRTPSILGNQREGVIIIPTLQTLSPSNYCKYVAKSINPDYKKNEDWYTNWKPCLFYKPKLESKS